MRAFFIFFMIAKSKKAEIVEGLKENMSRQKIAIFSDFQGISVARLQALRRTLKKEDAEYKVAKKTLFDRMLGESGISMKVKDLKGEIGVAFGYGDQVAPARVLAKFAKENETFKILGAILGASIMQGKDVVALAQLPGRDVLLAQVAGAFSGPIRGLVSALQANVRNLAFVVSRVRDNKNN